MIEKEDPVLKALFQRKISHSKFGRRDDGRTIGVYFQGGGMRGARSGGMGIAFQALGLTECVDIFGGSSAGVATIAYLLSEQTPEGASIYYKDLAGRHFIDPRRPFLPGTRKGPVMQLSYFTDNVMGEGPRKIRWENANQEIPFEIEVTQVTAEDARTIVLNGPRTFDQIRQETHYSCRYPIVAGLPLHIGSGVYYTDGAILRGGLPRLEFLNKCTDVLFLSTRSKNEDSLQEKYTLADSVFARVLQRYHPSLAREFRLWHRNYRQAFDRLEHGQIDLNANPRVSIIRVNGNRNNVHRLETNPDKLHTLTHEGYDSVMQAFIRYLDRLKVTQSLRVLGVH